MTIAITAPTGNIGSHLVELLLNAKADLTLLVRNPDKLDANVRSRVNVQQGELQDADFVRRATRGAEALFFLAPPNFTAPSVHAYSQSLRDAAVAAIQANNIPRVVLISSSGAEYPNAGLVTEAFHTEEALNATSAQVLSLRCGFFMENFLMYLPTLRNQGAFYGLNRPDLPAPMVATRDIAQAAARKLLEPSWQGSSRLAVHGPADVTLEQAAQILSEATGKTIRYVQVPAEQVQQTFLQMGASPDFAANYIQMVQAFEQGSYEREPRTPETTTPTTLAQWAGEALKPALNAA